MFVKQPWSDRKLVWGQEVAYFLRQKGAIEKSLRFPYMFSKLWERISPSELFAISTLEFSNTDFSIEKLKTVGLDTSLEIKHKGYTNGSFFEYWKLRKLLNTAGSRVPQLLKRFDYQSVQEAEAGGLGL